MYNLNKNLVYEFDLRNTFQFSSVSYSLKKFLFSSILPSQLVGLDGLSNCKCSLLAIVKSMLL